MEITEEWNYKSIRYNINCMLLRQLPLSVDDGGKLTSQCPPLIVIYLGTRPDHHSGDKHTYRSLTTSA